MPSSIADPRIEFLSAMAAALSRYGETADDLEQGLRDCAARLGVFAEFFATPTAVFASFGPSGMQQTVLLRTREARIDLQGLSTVHDVLEGVRGGRLTAEQGLAELNLAMTAPPRFPWYMGVFGSAVGAASFDLLLGGTWREAGIAATVGLAIGLLIALGRRFDRLARLTELLAGLAASLLALGWGHIVHDMSPATVALASLILLLPGLGITLGVAELASRQLAAGSARLAGATVTLLSLSIGSFLGTTILRELDLMPRTHVPAVPTTAAMLVVATALATVALLDRDELPRPRPLARRRVGRDRPDRRALGRVAPRRHRRRHPGQSRRRALEQRVRTADPPPGHAGADARARCPRSGRARLQGHLGLPAHVDRWARGPGRRAGDRRRPRRGPPRRRRDADAAPRRARVDTGRSSVRRRSAAARSGYKRGRPDHPVSVPEEPLDSFSVLIGGKAGDGITEAGGMIAHVLNRLGYRLYRHIDSPSLIRGGHNFVIVRAHRGPYRRAPRPRQRAHRAQRRRPWRRTSGASSSGQSPCTTARRSRPRACPPWPTPCAPASPSRRSSTGRGALSVMRNTAILGAFCKAFSIPWAVLEDVITRYQPKKTELNLKVARRGYDLATEKLLIDLPGGEPLPVVSGLEAIGLGLVPGGLKAYAGYPMTPPAACSTSSPSRRRASSSRSSSPRARSPAMLMALGHAYAGERVAVGTSGGGFALMVEGLSLAGQAELPIVVVLGQRPGPSTGLPTYTAQSDLEFALTAGHGEFPRAVIAPGDVEQAYAWSTLALDLGVEVPAPRHRARRPDAERQRAELRRGGSPASCRASPQLDWDGTPMDTAPGLAYKRYVATDDGVSPLAFPGRDGAVVKVNSYTHDEFGVTTEDPATTVAMQDKWLRKGRAMAAELDTLPAVNVYGDPASPRTVVTWGSPMGALREIAELTGIRVVQPVVLWPFPQRRLDEALAGSEQGRRRRDQRHGSVRRADAPARLARRRHAPPLRRAAVGRRRAAPPRRGDAGMSAANGRGSVGGGAGKPAATPRDLRAEHLVSRAAATSRS